MLDKAFDALKTYDWGGDLTALQPIDDAIVATHNDRPGRAELEGRLAAVLKTDASRAAKDLVCRKLKVVGSSASVPALAELLADQELAHMARYALQAIPAPEAAQAMREVLGKLSGLAKIGVIGSLGARQDAASVAALASLVGDADTSVAKAAACALGAIRSAGAADALAGAKPQSPAAKLAATDASLACAEQLLGDGNAGAALAIYKGLAKGDQPKHVRLAATRGMLACAGKKG